MYHTVLGVRTLVRFTSKKSLRRGASVAQTGSTAHCARGRLAARRPAASRMRITVQQDEQARELRAAL
jgi:hypothetical protein